MPSSPLPYSKEAQPKGVQANPRIPLVSMVLGLMALAFGCGLAGLTLVGAISGYAAIGVFDLTIGAMFLAFSFQSARFGLDVTAGRQSVTGHALR